MSKRYQVVESNLARTATRWKWLRLVERLSTLGAIVSLLVLILGVSCVREWITNRTLAIAGLAVIFLGAIIALALLAINIMAEDLQRKWLAGSLERVNPTLLDRLNTLIFLERAKANDALDSYARRIAKQTLGLLRQTPLTSPFSASRSLAHLAAFIAAVAVTIFVYQRYSPWEHLRSAPQLARADDHRTDSETPVITDLPDTTTTEEVKAWGEIRITEPGHDLRVTKVDVIPMQIEAATSQVLTNVGWLHTLNGAGEQGHSLPAPTEPRFAVYQPTLYLDELKLAEWDVLTYYAKASTDKNTYSSDVFFVEVRPFHEDILKMPGGVNGKARKGMNELSTLIERQQQIIRQTHRYQAQPHADAKLQEQDRDKLAQGEGELGEATKHLSAELTAEMDPAAASGLKEELDAAQQTMNKARGSLQNDLTSDAQQQERGALNQLVAARKYFQKIISENPEKFNEPPEDASTAGAEGQDKLEQMAEFRNEQKAAQDFVEKALGKQKSISQRANLQQPATFLPLGAEEKGLEKSLEFFEGQHPQAFQEVRDQLKAAEEAMKTSAQSLEKRHAGAKKDSQQATEKLEQLQQIMHQQDVARQLADAYKLKEMLDKQIKTLGQCQNPGSGSGGSSGVSDEQMAKTASAAKATTDQLKKLAEQPSATNPFGPKLRESLSNANKQALDQKLDEAGKAKGEEARKPAAGAAKAELEKVAKAFHESQPPTLQQAKKTDSLKNNPGDGFERGLELIESLAQRHQNQRRLPPEDEAKQRREALQSFQEGVPERFGHNAQSAAILVKLAEELKDKPTPLDEIMIQKLIAELKHFSTEVKDTTAPKPEDPQMTSIDVSKLPPAYRGRIEKYFQKLSERK